MADTTTRHTGNTGNGWPVIDVRREVRQGVTRTTIYLRIPAELATPCGGCDCAYCKAHPERIPSWDTLAVCDTRADHSWTVHYPDPRPLTPADRAERERRSVAFK